MKSLILKSIGIFLIILALSLSIGDTLIDQRKPTIESFAFLHTLGYQFYLLIPVELLFLYYISEGHNAIFLTILAIGTAIISQMIDYLIGLLASKKIINNYIGINRYEKIKRNLGGRYKDLIIFFFNLTFLSSPIIAAMAGIMRIKTKEFLLYSFLGLTTKYIILAIAYFQLY